MRTRSRSTRSRKANGRFSGSRRKRAATTGVLGLRLNWARKAATALASGAGGGTKALRNMQIARQVAEQVGLQSTRAPLVFKRAVPGRTGCPHGDARSLQERQIMAVRPGCSGHEQHAHVEPRLLLGDGDVAHLTLGAARGER